MHIPRQLHCIPERAITDRLGESRHKAFDKSVRLVRHLKLHEMARADSAGEFHLLGLLENGFESRMVNGLRKAVCQPGPGDYEGRLWHGPSWRGSVGGHELEFGVRDHELAEVKEGAALEVRANASFAPLGLLLV